MENGDLTENMVQERGKTIGHCCESHFAELLKSGLDQTMERII
jgi:hypothetical protein